MYKVEVIKEKIKAMKVKCIETYSSIVIEFIKLFSSYVKKIMSLIRERKSYWKVKNEGPDNQSGYNNHCQKKTDHCTFSLQKDPREENAIQGSYIQQSCLPSMKDLNKTILNVK